MGPLRKAAARRRRQALRDEWDNLAQGRPAWLIDNGLVVRRVVPAGPTIMVGHHGYGDPGFDGYRLTPEARDLTRHLFGADVWTTE